MTASHDPQQTQREFREVVNMTPAALRRWLETDDSKSVGMTPGGERVTEPGAAESVGHHMGERILKLKETPAAELTGDDYAEMRKVTATCTGTWRNARRATSRTRAGVNP